MSTFPARLSCRILALGLLSGWPGLALAQAGNQWAPQPATPAQPAQSAPRDTVWSGGQGAAGPVYAPDDLDQKLSGEASGAPAVPQPAPQALQAPVQPSQPAPQQPVYAPLQPARPPAAQAPAVVQPQVVQPQAVPGTALPATGLYGLPYGVPGYGALPLGLGAPGYVQPYAAPYATPYAGPGIGLPYYGTNIPGSTMFPLGSTDFTPGLLGTSPYTSLTPLYGGSPYFGGAPFGFW